MQIVNQEHPALSTVSAEVPHGDDVFATVAEMRDLLFKTSGCGLAANQVGITKRIIILNTLGFMGAIINPVITKESGKLKRSPEGCLSFPKLHVDMKRDNIVTVGGFDENWNPIKKKCRALTAFAVQHEIDHLNGITIQNK